MVNSVFSFIHMDFHYKLLDCYRSNLVTCLWCATQTWFMPYFCYFPWPCFHWSTIFWVWLVTTISLPLQYWSLISYFAQSSNQIWFLFHKTQLVQIPSVKSTSFASQSFSNHFVFHFSFSIGTIKVLLFPFDIWYYGLEFVLCIFSFV